MAHTLKIMKCYADAKVNGDKPFEIRYNEDRGFQKGDIVYYQALNPDGSVDYGHTINNKMYKITYVSAYKQREGYVVFADKEVAR